MLHFFKRFFACALILFITFPTTAAVSVSDGSAFVSKAEFAANLNNLNSRMSNLENSLDAKIDSPVSSYLSRNGIWNGEKQTLTSYEVSFSADENVFVPDLGYKESSTNNLVANISKSGLLCVNYFYYSNSALGLYRL